MNGKRDDHTGWMRFSAIELYADKYGIAVVMPTTDLGFYINTKYDAKYWDFISEELPTLCEQFFPQLSTKREDRFAAGLSMGGYGAMKLGLAASDKFSMAASLSGALDIKYAEERYLNGEEAMYWRGSFGEMSELIGTENDLFYLANKLKLEQKIVPKLYAWCGEQDFLFKSNEKFIAHLDTLGMDITYETSEGDHRWEYWDKWIQRVLEWIQIQHDVI